MQVLVTGAGGFLGRALVRRLAFEGHETLALGRALAPGRDGQVRRVRGSTEDESALRALLEDAMVDAVVHLSAYPDAPLAEAGDIFEANVGGTLRVLRAAADATRTPHVVLASSIKVYGRAETMPLTESTPEAPTSAYAIAKAASDRLGLLYHEQASVPVTVLRLTQVYGPGQPKGMLVAQLVEAARRGTSLEMTRGEQTRDLLYLDDAVNAFCCALERPEAAGRVTNVGSGVEVRLCDLVETFHALLPDTPRPRIGVLPYREGEMWRLVVDPTSARANIGFEARVSIEQGLASTIEAGLGAPDQAHAGGGAP